jgi:hypothetical protein
VDGSTGFTVGQSVDITRSGAGTLTIVAGAGQTVNSTPGLALRAQYSVATLTYVATNTWLAYGDLS